MPNYSGIWTEQAVMQAVGAGNWPGNPGAPTIGTATAGDASASVTFTAPTDNGGSAITGYTVTSSPGGLTGTGASSPITVSGLTNGTAYTFTVTATNATGTGPASAASNSVTPVPPNYIEDVYSTYLYTGSSSTQTITNGIDLSTYGGLVWMKVRAGGTQGHVLVDSARGFGSYLQSQLTDAQGSIAPSGLTALSNGFSVAGNSYTPYGLANYAGFTFASWTFRKQAKFFDVVTYTGTGVARTIAHSLGSVPGCIIIKRTDASGTLWYVYHRANTSGGSAQSQELRLNNANATNTNTDVWNNTAPTSTVFSIGAGASPYDWNASGGSYVAYLFAHNAGGFGLSGSENVISCGSCTADGSGNFSATLGYEPQWVLVKSVSTSRWDIFDNMRGVTASSGYSSAKRLNANLSDAEDTMSSPYGLGVSATGFTGNIAQGFGSDLIYIAIRRGPMAVPTSGTSVYNAISRTGTGATADVTGVGFPPDMLLDTMRSTGWNRSMWDRLRGANKGLQTNNTNAEASYTDAVMSYNQDGVTLGADGNFDVNASGYTYINWFFRRAPSFFDEVCYTGTGSNTNFSHNLNVAPQLIILKNRVSATNWFVPYSGTSYMVLNGTSGGANGSGAFDLSLATASTFWLGADGGQGYNGSGQTYVAYLFATCAGVSKVGSYTGTGALQTINCGFAAGARFVLIKRTDSTGDWYTYDSARGITSSNDPYLFLNSTAAEVTGTNYVDTTSVGFQVTAAAPAGLNASGGTYIFLAIA